MIIFGTNSLKTVRLTRSYIIENFYFYNWRGLNERDLKNCADENHFGNP